MYIHTELSRIKHPTIIYRSRKAFILLRMFTMSNNEKGIDIFGAYCVFCKTGSENVIARRVNG